MNVNQLVISILGGNQATFGQTFFLEMNYLICTPIKILVSKNSAT